ncbi:MAG: hypothetical protein MMC33_000145 [Icmadophila ericetorum]|nr:hypothetical protein [Icmadophila ericetorum]
MFLITNHIASFDVAFKSRIHLAIKYPALSPTSRRILWKSFIASVSPEPSQVWLDRLNPESLDSLASEDVNERQIKNIVRTAYALATSQSETLAIHHFKTVLNATKAFETDFAKEVAKLKAEDQSIFNKKAENRVGSKG